MNIIISEKMKKRIRIVYNFIDILLLPFLFIPCIAMKVVRKRGINHFPLLKRMYRAVGIFPIIDHYYEPLFNPKYIRIPLDCDRKLTGINMNVEGQLQMLKEIGPYSLEIRDLCVRDNNTVGDLKYYYENGSYEYGDADALYCIIRRLKPQRIVEIGSGNSTRIAVDAITMNKNEDSNYSCYHVCIEPYEVPWLDKMPGVHVIRKKLEYVGTEVFEALTENDILFIDSSHIIRPQGDVLLEYLELLPILKKGVIIQIHDIFTPRDYKHDWVCNKVRLWNEQYLLEAFLTDNNKYSIILAMNYLMHNHFETLSEIMPILKSHKDCEPGAFWIKKITS